MAVRNNDQKHHPHNASRKIAKFIVVLIVIATFQWFSSATSSLSSISSFIQGSGKGSRIVKMFDRKKERQEEDEAFTVLLIHYHKTGNNFITDLLTEIDKTHKQQRHDLAMKDPFLLNRAIKRAEETSGNDTELSSATQDARRLTEMDEGDRDEPEPKERKRQKRKKPRNSIKAMDDSGELETKKARKHTKTSTSSSSTDEVSEDKNSTGLFNRASRKRYRSSVDATIQSELKKANAMETPKKRFHDTSTGCPHMGDDEFDVGAAYRLTAPDLFCNLSLPVRITKELNKTIDLIKSLAQLNEAEVDVELDNLMRKQEDSHAAPPKLPFPPWKTTKVVHFVRDPFDMALSNYLYHSQSPTPESWVLARHLNPCAPNDELVNYTMGELSSRKERDPSFPKVNISADDLLQVTELCRYYRRDHPLDGYRPKMTKAFYPLLRKLPPYDGLRVATTQFLLANNPQSGGDLLRMSNNVLRLQEWEADSLSAMGIKSQSIQSSHILTVSMGNIVKDMSGSIQKICHFIFGHISNNTMRSGIAQDIADAMVTMYNSKEQASEEIRIEKARRKNDEESLVFNNTIDNSTIRMGSHVTQGLLNATDRQLLKKQLETDPVLGNVMLQLREILNSAKGGM